MPEVIDQHNGPSCLRDYGDDVRLISTFDIFMMFRRVPTVLTSAGVQGKDVF